MPAEPQTILMTPYYRDPSADRQKELDDCVTANSANKFIRNVILLSEAKDVAPEITKLSDVRFIGRRAMFSDFFAIAGKEFSGKTCIVANTDILFDDTIRLVESINLAGRCLALSRRNAPGQYEAGALSQDAWIFRAPLPPIHADIPLGRPGCDNRIVFELCAAGMQVMNPCRCIAAWHKHASGARRYTSRDRVRGPIYGVPPMDGLPA